jgi:hypothetical protein
MGATAAAVLMFMAVVMAAAAILMFMAVNMAAAAVLMFMAAAASAFVFFHHIMDLLFRIFLKDRLDDIILRDDLKGELAFLGFA